MIRWKKDFVPGDFDAAEGFLSLRLNPEKAKRLVKRLKPQNSPNAGPTISSERLGSNHYRSTIRASCRSWRR
jgi:hypothetical protein